MTTENYLQFLFAGTVAATLIICYENENIVY